MVSATHRFSQPGEMLLAGLSALVELQRGRLVIVTPDGARRSLVGPIPEPFCSIEIRNWLGFFSALPFGSAALGRAYARGDFEASDLVALAQLRAVPGPHAARLLRWSRAIIRRLQGWRQRLRANTRRGARRNIRFHYDLGNDFYALWLDPSMTYSAALFDGQTIDLETAQEAKYARMLAETRVPAGGQLLEVGCGWGGFAEYAGRRGYKVSAITISEAQFHFARRRIAAAGLDDSVTIEFLDYRDLEGVFDGIVSIEMIEAVGEAYWPSYFTKVAEVLRPGGRAVIQSTTIPAERFADYSDGTDFIREEVFPGGMLIPVGRMQQEARFAGLRLKGAKTFGLDYAKTLELWCEAFDRQQDELHALGFCDRFIRTWRLYLRGCQGCFEAGDIDVGQYTFERLAVRESDLE